MAVPRVAFGTAGGMEVAGISGSAGGVKVRYDGFETVVGSIALAARGRFERGAAVYGGSGERRRFRSSEICAAVKIKALHIGK